MRKFRDWLPLRESAAAKVRFLGGQPEDVFDGQTRNLIVAPDGTVLVGVPKQDHIHISKALPPDVPLNSCVYGLVVQSGVKMWDNGPPTQGLADDAVRSMADAGLISPRMVIQIPRNGREVVVRGSAYSTQTRVDPPAKAEPHIDLTALKNARDKQAMRRSEEKDVKTKFRLRGKSPESWFYRYGESQE